MSPPRSQSQFSLRRTSNSQRSKPPVRAHHVRDLEAALAASIGRNFDVLSRQFRETWSKTQRTDSPRS